MINYPGYHNLPEWDPAYAICEAKDISICEDLPRSSATLWFARKLMQESKDLRDYVGNNEKTKAICRLQSKEAGAPVSEPRVDKETYHAMLNFYRKKEKEQKELEADDDDSYLNSDWANPQSLKKSLHGIGDAMKWR
eukprot:GHVU01191626.1.p1 GENE.GHVU01191626.1~~GHVU01191626.1.p1  ORF type:complete len:137 (+),score=24.35 GHVU01191626.1:539-949(+)